MIEVKSSKIVHLINFKRNLNDEDKIYRPG
jgi:hypothetical protein